MAAHDPEAHEPHPLKQPSRPSWFIRSTARSSTIRLVFITRPVASHLTLGGPSLGMAAPSLGMH